MTKKIFRSIFAVAISVFLACLAVILGVLTNYYSSVQDQQLKSALSLAQEGTELGGMAYLENTSVNGERLTWIKPDGTVVFDSQADPSAMENHKDREEVKDALENGTGTSARYSKTLTEQTSYHAVRLSDGSVLRISASRYTVFAIVISMLQPFLIVIAIALVLSFVLARRLSKKIVKPLESIDLDNPLGNETYDELAPMLRRLAHQHRQIRLQQDELTERRNEFAAVTGCMNEGLVLLNKNGIILSINTAAREFFGVTRDCSGLDFTALDRDLDTAHMIDSAKKTGAAELSKSRSGREYRLSASSVLSGGDVSGVVILIIDITEKVFAERNRREFTANVSHELKTPLQGIMGSAELLENGLVKPEDTPRFIGRIRSESERLVWLIDDIIRLSQIDEKSGLVFETLDLYAIAAEELKSLELAADDMHVSLKLEGGSEDVRGVRELIHELVYNLVSNAVKYNVYGGSVTVSVGGTEDGAVLTVSDTGIGIAKEHQERIFERFYRVDKSHSREVGGTGLGLSIVKHAVADMDGSISLESIPGKGTSIKITLPRPN